MKTLEKILSFIIVSILLLHSIENTAYASPDVPVQKLSKAAVFLNNSSDLFISDAKELIDQGITTGTVIEDLRTQANAIYSVGMNLVSGNNTLSGTNYKFDETGITIKAPYYEYVK